MTGILPRMLMLIVALLFSAASAHAQNFPKPNNTRVVDAANLLDPAQEAALDAKLRALEDQTTRQVVVTTIPDLQGYPIDDYGYRLGRAWGIGQKSEKNGALLIIAPNDRKVRIEVGYGLEPILTDAFSSVIINTQIVPRFKAGDFPGGINAGTDAIIEQLRLPPEEAAKVARQLAAKRAQGNSEPDIGAVIFWLFIFFFFILPVISPLIFGRGRRGRRFGSGPVIIWGGGSDWGGGGSSWGSGGGFGGGGGFSGGGGSFGGGGSSGSW
jgi:uncharacterized protein